MKNLVERYMDAAKPSAITDAAGPVLQALIENIERESRERLLGSPG